MIADKQIIWNAARVDQLAALVGDGLSGSQIASAMGLSRNAVIGKVSRLGLKLAGGDSGAIRARPAPKVRLAKPLPPQPLILANEPEAIGPNRDFPGRGACRWIQGDPGAGADWRCCGQPANGTYCDFHRAQSVSPEASARFRKAWGLSGVKAAA